MKTDIDKSGSLSTAWTEQQGQVNRVTNQPNPIYNQPQGTTEGTTTQQYIP